MSHFVVLVTRTDEEPLEEQLEPFFEQGDEDDYFMEKEYYLKKDEKEVQEWLKAEISKAENREKDALKEFKEELPDITEEELEKAVKKLSKESVFSELGQSLEKVKLGGIARRIVWAKSEQKELQKIQQLKNLDRKMKAIKKYNGGGLDSEGLYWLNNPEAKWDWWVEGGRWDKWLVKKDGTRCNRCLVKEVDFDGMRKAEIEDHSKYYDNEIAKAKEEERKPCFWGFEDTPTKEEWMAKFKPWICPYAVLHEGEWMEKGEMGWWGIDDPHCTDEEWDEKFQKFIKELDPETEIAIVDCHI